MTPAVQNRAAHRSVWIAAASGTRRQIVVLGCCRVPNRPMPGDANTRHRTRTWRPRPSAHCTASRPVALSDRTQAADRPARLTSPSARRWWRPDARSARRIRCCAGLARVARSKFLGQRGLTCQPRVAFSPQFRDGALKFGDRVVLRRGHWPSPRRAPCRSAIGMHLARVKIVAMFPPGWPGPRHVPVASGSDAKPRRGRDPNLPSPRHPR